jgi:undecaprenyl-diphosphatase
LLWADSLPERRNLDTLRIRDGLLVGAAQVLALFPGTSRSGITISMARYLGIDREDSARISFLWLPPDVAGPMIVGTAAAAISGYFAIRFLLRYVQTHSYKPFVYYRFAAGAAVLLIIATGLRPATF